MAASERKWQQTAVMVSHAALPVDMLITDCPSSDAVGEFADMLHSYGVSHLLRICEASAYNKQPVEAQGIAVHELFFEDGTPPTSQVMDAFRALIDSASLSATATAPASSTKPTFAIHCISGIGRAPVLVCVALIDGGMDPMAAIEFVRSKRRGAINKVQLAWLLDTSGKGFKRRATKKSGSLAGIFKGLFKKSSSASLKS
eukprot:jgi/Hompol1/1279/HPOL_001156-RA